MLLVYFGLWLLFNGRVTADVLLVGAFASGLVYLFTWKIVGLTPGRELKALRKVPGYARYLAVVFVEIIKANRVMIHIILDPTKEPEPELHYLHYDLEDDSSRVLLANAITLTPGTITVEQDGGEFTVHAIDGMTAEGLEDICFYRMLKEQEEKAK